MLGCRKSYNTFFLCFSLQKCIMTFPTALYMMPVSGSSAAAAGWGKHPVSLPLLLATAFCSFILLCEDLHSFVCLRIAYHGKQEAEMVTLLVQGLVEPVFSAERCYHSHWRLTGNHKGEEWRGSTEQ